MGCKAAMFLSIVVGSLACFVIPVGAAGAAKSEEKGAYASGVCSYSDASLLQTWAKSTDEALASELLALPPAGVQVLDGGSGRSPSTTCVQDPTQTKVGSDLIAAQCCDADNTCRRFVGTNDAAGCIVGKAPAIVATTYADAVQKCMALGLQLCEQSCKGKGCSYNNHPVWTKKPCELPMLPPGGVQVLDGGSGNFPSSTCVQDPSQTQVGNKLIAAQCCDTDGECRRFVGTNDAAGCIVGKAPAILATTYAEAELKCTAMGLQLCEQSCAGKGCSYNSHPVWTKKACDATTPAPTPHPTFTPTLAPTSASTSSPTSAPSLAPTSAAPTATPAPSHDGLPACKAPADRSRGQCESCFHGDQCPQGYYCCPYMKKCVNSASMSCSYPIANCNNPRCYDSSCDKTVGCDCSGCSNVGANKQYDWLVWANLKNSNGQNAEATCIGSSGTMPTPAPDVSDISCKDTGLPATWTCAGAPCTCEIVSSWGLCNHDYYGPTILSGCPLSCNVCDEDAPNSPSPTPLTPSPPSPTLSPPSPSPRPPSGSEAKVSARAWEHFVLVNQLRSEGFTCPNGATFAANDVPLQFDCRLWKASQLHSQDMADNAYFSHSSQDGRSPWDRANAQGISANGENIAAGRDTAEGVLEQWENSDGHCRNMGNPSFKLFAVGYAFNAGSPYRHYWTQMFKTAVVDLDTSCYPEEGQSTGSARLISIVSEAFESTTPAPSSESGEPVGEPWSTDDFDSLHDKI